MSPHVSDELPRLLTGEAPRDVVLDAAAHLRTCIDCQQELVLAVVAHASLTSAQRFAPEVVSRPTEVARSVESARDSEPEPQLPDLSAMFERVRTEGPSPSRSHGSRRVTPRVRYGLIGVAAAAVVGVASYGLISGNDAPTGTTSAQTIALQAYDTGKTPARVTVRSGGRMDIDAAALPNLSSSHYEVWLTNDVRTDMQPIGWLGADGKATLTVPPNLMNRFSDIEVSVQDIAAANYSYSGTSVLRGAYA